MISKIETLENLQILLDIHGINSKEWGKGRTKTVADLFGEIVSQETILEIQENGVIVRKLSVIGAKVFYIDQNNQRFYLKEDKQVFNDDRIRKRDLSCSVSEKMKANESPEQALIRGLQEELGVFGDLNFVDQGSTLETADSPSYPGLFTKYTRYSFDVVLNSDQYNPNGYTEVQSDKKNYFVWQKVE